VKKIIFIILLFSIFSCSSYNESKKVNTEKAEAAYSKFNNMKNDLSYDEFKSLIITYSQNKKFPDINK
tara:strand:+ start:408 stop:611 length:204 start_codon:yes stop_codon:yes gene_type:complete